MKLSRYPETLAVVKLAPGAEVPEWAESSSIFSITATATETSVVCAARSVPRKSQHQRPFTAFEVEGPLDFALTGVLSSLLQPLADAGISVFTVAVVFLRYRALLFTTFDPDVADVFGVSLDVLMGRKTA